MTVARIYAVKRKFDQSRPVMVKANTQAQALRHVMRSTHEVTVASALDVAEHMGDGYKIDDATAEPEPTTEAIEKE